MSGERPPLVVYHSRRWWILIATVLLALLGLLLLTARSPSERMVGGVCAVLFGVSALVMARPRKRPPALIVDSEGLTDAASGLAAGFLPWSRVTGVVVQKARGQRCLSVLVSEPEAVVAGAEPSIQAAMRANLTLLGSPVNIPLRPMTVRVEELTLELARHTPAALPAALRARVPAGSSVRPPATSKAIEELVARAAEASVVLPEAYLEFLTDQDGFVGKDLRIYGTRSRDGLEGVLEVNVARRTDTADEQATPSPDGYVLLARDATHDYCAHTADGVFCVLARSDHRSLAQLSTFSDLMVAALTDFTNPFG